MLNARAAIGGDGVKIGYPHGDSYALEINILSYVCGRRLHCGVYHAVKRPFARVIHRTEMYLIALRRFIEAMGGELEIVARFSDHAV